MYIWPLSFHKLTIADFLVNSLLQANGKVSAFPISMILPLLLRQGDVILSTTFW